MVILEKCLTKNDLTFDVQSSTQSFINNLDFHQATYKTYITQNKNTEIL